jgi:hypothetical protein
MLRRVLIVVIVLVGAPALLRGQDLAAAPAGVLALLRGIVFDSLTGAGRRDGQTYAVADDSAAAWLAAAHVSLTARNPAAMPTCPGSTAADEQLVAPPVGYLLEVRLRAEDAATVWVLDVKKRCHFIFRGTVPISSRFAEQAIWEARMVDGVWRIVRSRGHRIT